MNNVVGKVIDNETRCVHWNGPTDIIALKFKCCPNVFYPCYQCHNELTNHQIERFDLLKQPDIKCILCGNCQIELTFNKYISDDYHCPNCHHQFNSGCKLHYHLYFDNIPPTQSLNTCNLK